MTSLGTIKIIRTGPLLRCSLPVNGLTQLGIGWKVGVASGWGTYGTNLAVQLRLRGIAPALFFLAPELELTKDQAALLERAIAEHRQWDDLLFERADLPFPMLSALGNNLTIPETLRGLRGRPNIGVAFFESPVIPPENVNRAKAAYACIVTGSSWNKEILEARGLVVRNCLQGIDPQLFFPAPRTGRFSGRFAIFSGGKLEYRKGQDLVVAAFRRFHERHDDALLVTAWHSPWPGIAQSLSASAHAVGFPGTDAFGRLDIAGWLRANGLPDSSFLDLGTLANRATPSLLREIEVALLPSRAEGGTNLVAMECMACGVPVILSRNTGHLDLIGPDNCYVLEDQMPLGAPANRAAFEGWGESSVDEIVARLEEVYADRTEAARRGGLGAVFMKDWSWSTQTDRMLAALAGFG